MKPTTKLIFWLPVPILYALFVVSMPDTSFESVLITQAPFLALSFVVIYSLFKNQLNEKIIKLGILFAALFGLAFASYLTIKWQQQILPECSSGGCSKAQFSKYADMFFGIRTATVGIIGYTLVLFSLLLKGEFGRIITLALATFGFVVSVYLTFSSVFDLETTCQWCLGSASAMTTIFILSLARLWFSQFLNELSIKN
jgi:uncharacterized membrane protein